MSASIFVRASSAFKSQIEIGVGSIERLSHRQLSRQTVREVETIIDDIREQRFTIERNRDEAAREEARLRVAAAEWGEKAAYVIRRGRTDLAEQAVGRQLDAERDAEAAAALQQTAAAEIERLTALSAELNDERRRMSEELAAIEAEDVSFRPHVARTTPEQRAERVRARFDRLIEGKRADAKLEPADSSAGEIDALRRADQVAERLATLRNANEGSSEPQPA